MGWYKALKDGIRVVQKADNLQLVRDLLEAQQQIFDFQGFSRYQNDRKTEYKVSRIYTPQVFWGVFLTY